MFFIFLFIVFFAVLFESTITSLPLLLLVVTIMFILHKEDWVIGLAFFGGIFLDIATVHTVGSTSMFLASFLFLILLYEHKYEIDSIPFILVSIFFGSLFYLWFFNSSYFFLQAIISAILGCMLFILFRKLISQKISSKQTKLPYL